MLNWHGRNLFRIGKYFSWRLFIVSFLSNFSLFFSKIKHKLVFDYLTPQISEIIEKYKNIKEEPYTEMPKIIWVLWWQGIENAPSLVQTCINRIAMNKGTELVVLTKDNINEYVSIPDYVLSKKEKDIISFAHLSDVIRLTVLEKYGGLWLDATVFLSDSISDEVFSSKFYSMHNLYNEKTKYISHDLWRIFVLGSIPHGKLISFLKETFCEYIKNNQCLLDYLTVDYLIMIAYINFPDIKEEIDALNCTSEKTYNLLDNINKPFNQKDYEEMKDGVVFFKTIWNKKFKVKSHGKDTYYSVLFCNNENTN